MATIHTLKTAYSMRDLELYFGMTGTRDIGKRIAAMQDVLTQYETAECYIFPKGPPHLRLVQTQHEIYSRMSDTLLRNNIIINFANDPSTRDTLLDRLDPGFDGSDTQKESA